MLILFKYKFIVLGVLLVLLVLPFALGRKSRKQIAVSLLVFGLGVLLPLYVFFMSAFLVPEWKGGCRHGWIDCFHMGKLALTPLVILATGTLYIFENHFASSARRFIVLGFLTGSVVASICFVFGVFTVGINVGAIWLLVPGYVAVWHSVRAIQLIKISKPGWFSYLLTICGSIPFWIGSVIWSRRLYESLPDEAPQCFVVTAASRGHAKLVGPFAVENHHGKIRNANQQLVTLWKFEALWSSRAPRSHAAFRRAYNLVGPVIARKIQSPWMADAVYLAIKPMELAAKVFVKIADARAR